jgi:hypothetical protein
VAAVSAAGVFAGAAATGLVTGAVEAAGVAAGAAVVGFAGVEADAVAAGAVAAVAGTTDAEDFFERVFFGVVHPHPQVLMRALRPPEPSPAQGTCSNETFSEWWSYSPWRYCPRRRSFSSYSF